MGRVVAIHRQEKFASVIRKYFLVAFAVWMAVIAVILIWDIRETRRYAVIEAKNDALMSLKKDVAFREWATTHGGVYVQVDETTPPNPYLTAIKERDLITPSGKHLTLMNPAYMARQLNEFFAKQGNIFGHITSLKLRNPNNKPDQWEEDALRAFEKGELERMEVADIDGKPFLRLMRPMITKEGCLKCHADQGYKVGDVRGGVGVSVALEPYFASARALAREHTVSYALIWLLGAIILQLGNRYASRLGLSRDRAEEALNIARREIDGLFNLSPDLLCGISNDGLFQRVNPSFPQLLGYQESELIGRSFLDFVHPEDRERSIREFALVRQGGTALNFDNRFVTKGGGIRWLSWSALMDADIGQVYAIGRNITGRKRAEMELLAAKETAEEATKLKDKFVSLVAHDLRGPLGSIVTYLNQLGRTSPSPEGVATMNSTAIATGKNMLSLIDDLLNISRIKTGKLKPTQKFVSAYFIGATVVEEFRHMAEQKGVTLVNDVLKDSRLYADESLLHEVVRNLVSNAIKFTGPGKSVRLFTPEETPAAIAVADEGLGIDATRLTHLFEYETKTSTLGTAGEMGTGLGLPLSRDIVEAHGGTLTAESVKGQGSVFRVELPLVKPRVLFADDDGLATMFMERYVAGMGLELRPFANGREAAELLGTWMPHLVITDVKMPEVDGFELVDFIRNNPATATIPIIMTSAFPDPALAARVENAHVADFISKPFVAEEVVSKIRRILG